LNNIHAGYYITFKDNKKGADYLKSAPNESFLSKSDKFKKRGEMFFNEFRTELSRKITYCL